MRNKRSAATLTRLLEHARYEVLPTASTEEKVLEHLPRDRVVTVTASPGKGLEATFDLGGGRRQDLVTSLLEEPDECGGGPFVAHGATHLMIRIRSAYCSGSTIGGEGTQA